MRLVNSYPVSAIYMCVGRILKSMKVVRGLFNAIVSYFSNFSEHTSHLAILVNADYGSVGLK